MNYLPSIQAAPDDPQKLEELYQAARQKNEAAAFHTALLACYETAPTNVLYAAWHYRLQHQEEDLKKAERSVNWKLAVPLGVLTGLIFWALSDFNLMFLDHIPYLALLWAPIATLCALVFLAATPRRNYRRTALAGLGLFAACAYVFSLAPGQADRFYRHYLDLMGIHLPLLAWIGLGISVLGLRSNPKNRFAFLIKSIEVMITAGLYLIAGVVFGGITIGMFEALNISLPDVIVRLIAAGGFGLLPVLAVASVYDPQATPNEQDFTQGLSRFIFTMMRLLLPLTLAVLAIYLVVIPFNFMEPFKNRNVLIVYNVMLFAIMGLLVGVTPVQAEGLSPKVQSVLRGGIVAVAALATLVSLYALSAVVYRTAQGGMTINRLTIIGWNGINIAILFLLIYKQVRSGREKWVASLQSVFSLGTNAYLVWAVFLILAIPLLFR